MTISVHLNIRFTLISPHPDENWKRRPLSSLAIGCILYRGKYDVLNL